jgi:acylphosphatase
MMNNPAGMRCRIYGKVQGVWFRARTRDEALRLNLRGFAKNLEDGTVEVLAFGEAECLDQLYQWLFHGSPKAIVTDVERQDEPWIDVEDFFVF